MLKKSRYTTGDRLPILNVDSAFFTSFDTEVTGVLLPALLFFGEILYDAKK